MICAYRILILLLFQFNPFASISCLLILDDVDSFCMFLLRVRSLEHSLKELREQEDETMAGQRGGRFAKWIACNEELRKKAGLEPPEKLK